MIYQTGTRGLPQPGRGSTKTSIRNDDIEACQNPPQRLTDNHLLPRGSIAKQLAPGLLEYVRRRAIEMQ